MYRFRFTSHSSTSFGLRGLFFAALLTVLSACSVTPAVGSEPDVPIDPALAELEVASPTPSELIFSAVKGTSSEPRTITLKNVGTAPLELSALTFSGTDGALFAAMGLTLPFTLEAGATQEITLAFTPDSAGTKSASLEVSTAGSGTLSLDLYGLGSEGEQGSNEPTLKDVVETLGYSVDVGGSDLELGKIAASIGDEIMASFFERASEQPVELSVVARYGPNEVFPYGYFASGEAPENDAPVLTEVGTIAAEDAQQLLPPVASGTTTFDPGREPFGIFGQAGGATQYSVDDLNTGEVTHAMRVYPLKDRSGRLVPDSYLIGLEEATNGDYQDVLFVLSNVVPLSEDGEEVPLE